METNKKQLLLEKGAQMMHRNGYHATGIQQIVQAAGVPKGSFYFYFKSKEDFGLEVIHYFTSYVESQLMEHLEDDEKTWKKRIQGFFRDFLDFFIHGDYTGGCPLGNLALEMGDTNEVFREALSTSFDGAIQALAGALEMAHTAGEISRPQDWNQLAEFIFFSWEGAVMQMKLTKNTRPLDQFENIVFNQLIQ